MIDKAEIDTKADELGVHTSNVQRDYVFGWLLAGVYQLYRLKWASPPVQLSAVSNLG
jgi:hypothetical protein